MRNSWYEFKNSGQKETTLFLYDEIGGFGKSAASFIQDLQAIPQDNRLVLRIHSPGGSVLDGNAIFTALKGHPGGVTTQIDGLAASMASVIAIAGAPVQMAGNGLMMIHNVSAGMSGDAEDHRKMADTIDKIQSTIERSFIGKTGLSRKKIRAMMDDETWMTASEAKDLGFIDEITGELEMAAKFDLTKFKNVPKDGAHGVIALPGTPNSLISRPHNSQPLRGRDGTPLPSAPLTATEPAMDSDISLNVEVVDATDKISNLETTIAALQEDKAGLLETISKLEASSQANTERNLRLVEDNKSLSTKNQTLEAEAKTAEARAREISARMQVNLPEKPAQAGEEGPKTVTRGGKTFETLTRSAFEQISHSERSAFIKGGGRLTND